MLAWSPSTDNVGVVEYGLYASRSAGRDLERAERDALEPGVRHQLSGRDRRGRCGRQPLHPVERVLPHLRLPLDQQATDDADRAEGHRRDRDQRVARLDRVHGRRRGRRLRALRRRPAHRPDDKTSADYTGLQCGTTYALGVDAYDNTGKRSTVAELSTATSPCAPTPPPTTGTVTQTIANGATLSGVVNWRAVYDRNGDGVEDDPGTIEFRVDGTLVLTEIN